MKKLRKVLSLLLVGVISVISLTFGSVTASADSSKAALITAKPSDIMAGAKWITPLGQDLYLLTVSAEKKEIYRIDSNIISSWRKSGKLNAKKVSLDSSITSHPSWGIVPNFDFSHGNYALLAYMENNVVYYEAVKYDKAQNKITSYYKTDDLAGISVDGMLAQYEYEKEKNKVTLYFINTDGVRYMVYANQFTSGGEAKWWGFNGGTKCAVTVSFSKSNSGSVALIGQDSKFEKIANNLPVIWAGRLSGNYMMYTVAPSAVPTDVYAIDTGKSYSVFGKKLSNFRLGGKDYYLSTLGETLYGTKAAAEYKDDSENSKYALVNISNGKILSGKYDSMLSRDGGKTYLVKDAKGKIGYLNKSGKELGMFDDAGYFMGKGKYAPVISSGKVYLVNSSLEKSSKTITVNPDSSVSTIGDELFVYSKGGKNYIMTFKA